MDVLELIRRLEKYAIPDILRELRNLGKRVTTQGLRITVLENHSPQRVVLVANNVPVGLSDIPVTWGTPLPGIDYTPFVLVNGSDNAITVLRIGINPGAKTTDGCTLRVNNTGAGAIATVGLEVAAVR